MTITIEIKPEVEAELAAQAAAKGMDVSAYAASLLEQAAQPNEPQPRKQTLSEFFMNSPLAGSGINLERDKDTGRDISLLEFLRDSPLVGLELDFERDKNTR
jgi:hypothetical protein